MIQEYQDQSFQGQYSNQLIKSSQKMPSKVVSILSNQKQTKLPQVKIYSKDYSEGKKEKMRNNLDKTQKNSYSLATLKHPMAQQLKKLKKQKGIKQQNQINSINKAESLKNKSLTSSKSKFMKHKSTSIYKVEQKVTLSDNFQLNKKKILISSLNRSEKQKVELYFPHKKQDLQPLNNDQIHRLNSKIKEYVLKLDHQLSNKIQTAFMKPNNETKYQTSAPKVINLLQASIKNNDVLLYNMQIQFNKLHNQSKQLNEDSFQMMFDKQKNRLQLQCKNQLKLINKLKLEAKNASNKLSDLQLRLLHKKMDRIKEETFNNQKQQEKLAFKLAKLQQKMDQMNQINSQIDRKMQQLIKQSKQKNISLINPVQNNDYSQELILKISKLRNLNNSTINQTSKGLIKAQNQLKKLKNEIRQCNEDIINTQYKSQSIITAALTLIQVHKQKINKKDYGQGSPISFFINKKQEYQSPIMASQKFKNSTIKQNNKQLKQIVQYPSQNEDNNNKLPAKHKIDNVVQNTSQNNRQHKAKQVQNDESNQFLKLDHNKGQLISQISQNDKNRVSITQQSNATRIDDSHKKLLQANDEKEKKQEETTKLIVPKRFQFRRSKQKQPQKQPTE